MKFNFDGRTSLIHCVYWGLAGVIYITWIEPWIRRLGIITDRKWIRVLTVLCTIFMVWNATISSLAAARRNERVHNIPAESRIDEYLDEHYPDEFLDKIFTNMRYRGENV